MPRVNEHLPTTGMFEPLYVCNLTFTGLGDILLIGIT